MQLGIANYAGFNISLCDFLNFAYRLKVEFVELKLDSLPIFLPSLRPKRLMWRRLINNNNWERLEGIFKNFTFEYIFHAQSIDVNLGSLNDFIRKASERTILNAVYLAALVDAKILVAHVGRLSRDYRKDLLSKSLANSISCLKRIANASKNLGVTFTVENDHASSDQVLAGYPRQLKSIIETVGCKFTFDIGHANTLGDPVEFIEELGRDIVNVHVHDNDDKDDKHMRLGEGTIDFHKVIGKLREIEYEGPIIVEVHSIAGLKESVNWIKHLTEAFR